MNENIESLQRVIERIKVSLKSKDDKDLLQTLKALEGIIGELIVRDTIFKNSDKINFMQVDGIILFKEKYFSIEMKHQEMFKKGSNINFDGHGLPEHQVKARLKIQKDLGIIPIFIVLDMGSKLIYYNRLDWLFEKEYGVTGKVKRVIFPISNFKLMKKDFLLDLL